SFMDAAALRDASDSFSAASAAFSRKCLPASCIGRAGLSSAVAACATLPASAQAATQPAITPPIMTAARAHQRHTRRSVCEPDLATGTGHYLRVGLDEQFGQLGVNGTQR